LEILKKTYHEWRKVRPEILAGGLAYFAIFSVTPLLVLIIGILGRFVARAEIMAQFDVVMGERVGHLIRGWLLPKRGHGLQTLTFFSVSMLLYGASSVFVQLKASLDHIWHVPVKTQHGWGAFIKSTLVPLAMILAAGVFILAFTVLDTGLGIANRQFGGFLPGIGRVAFWKGLGHLTSLALVTLFLGGIFKWVPDVKLRWRQIWPGALLTSALFDIGKVALGFYFSRRSYGSLYGAAGSLIVIMAWTYFSAQIFFFGAVFTRVFAQAHSKEDYVL
jgi:membrane protein